MVQTIAVSCDSKFETFRNVAILETEEFGTLGGLGASCGDED